MSQALGSTQKANVSLTFGVISVNVSVHSAVAESKEASLKLVCTGPHGVQELGNAPVPGAFVPMQRVTTCPECKSGEYLGHAKPVADGLVVIPEDVLEAADAADKAHGAEIVLNAHPVEQVEELTRPTGSRYYLNVKGGVSGNYALMRELVRANPSRAFMARFSLKGAAVPYRLMLDGETLMLVQMADPENVRARPAVTGEINQLHLDLANTLVAQSTTPYAPADYARPKSVLLAEYVEGKVPSQFAVTGTGVTGQVTDLFEALRASVAATAPKQAAVKKSPRKSSAKSNQKAS